jgi:carbonic anhydrase/acetyltransferase-like protein (isoleucine patch superfamily)
METFSLISFYARLVIYYLYFSRADIFNMKCKTLLIKCLIFYSVYSFGQIVEYETEGPLKIGKYTGNPMSDSLAGTIRWNPLDSVFQGWNGSEWLSLTSNPYSSFTTILPSESLKLLNKGYLLFSPLDDRAIRGPSWSIDGNEDSHLYLTPPKMGTKDNVPVIFITNNVKRMKIKEDGDIGISNTLEIGKDLNVKKNVFLNTLGGNSELYGPFSVLNSQSADFSGTLVIDKLTRLNDGLKVFGSTLMTGNFKVDKDYPSLLTGQVYVDDLTQSENESYTSGALVVDGGVGIAKNLNIGENFSLRGTAAFGGEVKFDSPVMINALEESTNLSNGALIVHGGVGIGKELNVKGAVDIDNTLMVADQVDLEGNLSVYDSSRLSNTLRVFGPTTLDNTLEVIDSTTLENTLLVIDSVKFFNTLDVMGAAYFKNTLHVEDNSDFQNRLKVENHTLLHDNVEIVGETLLNNTLQSNEVSIFHNTVEVKSTDNKYNSALQVVGGVGIGENINVGESSSIDKNLNVSGRTNIQKGISLKMDKSYVAEFENTTGNNGINIKIGNSEPGRENDFITFLSANDKVQGKITGHFLPPFVLGDDKKNVIKEDYVHRRNLEIYDNLADLYTIFVTMNSGRVLWATGKLYGAVTSFTPCFGFGACVYTPIASLIIYRTAALAAWITNLAVVSTELVEVLDARSDFVSDVGSRLGVSYQSGGADYAEWLPKQNLSDRFMPGMVIGVKGGKISLKTLGADNIQVISSNPIILGNMPKPEFEKKFEMVAFLGQVPVNVMGQVKSGDYIIPSGNNDGLAKAISPSKMRAQDYTQIVGMAWESSDNKIFSTINVAIGLNDADVSNVVSKQNSEIEKLTSELRELENVLLGLDQKNELRNRVLADLVPGYPSFQKNYKSKKTNWSNESIIQGSKSVAAGSEVSPNSIIRFDLSKKEVQLGIKLAKKLFLAEGGNAKTKSFWNKIESSEEELNLFIDQIIEKQDMFFDMLDEVENKLPSYDEE